MNPEPQSPEPTLLTTKTNRALPRETHSQFLDKSSVLDIALASSRKVVTGCQTSLVRKLPKQQQRRNEPLQQLDANLSKGSNFWSKKFFLPEVSNLSSISRVDFASTFGTN